MGKSRLFYERSAVAFVRAFMLTRLSLDPHANPLSFHPAVAQQLRGKEQLPPLLRPPNLHARAAFAANRLGSRHSRPMLSGQMGARHASSRGLRRER